MNRDTLNRVSELSFVIDTLQACLGQAAVCAGDLDRLHAAREIAADISESLDHWHLSLLQVPREQRDMYLSPNPFLERDSKIALYLER